MFKSGEDILIGFTHTGKEYLVGCEATREGRSYLVAAHAIGAKPV